jgi:hypothetical protein
MPFLGLNVLTHAEPMPSIGAVTMGSTGPAHTAPVSCVAFRADGGRLASGSHDRSVIVWDTTDPGRSRFLTEFGHRAPVTAVAWNPAAADLLATGSADGAAAVWRIVDDRPPSLMKVLAGHPGAVTAVDWMPDGQHLLCLIEGGRAAVWNAFTEAYLGELDDCDRLAVNPYGLVATVGADGLVAVRDLWRDPGRITYLPAAHVAGCAWSPDGDILALAREDGTLELVSSDLASLRAFRLDDAPLRGVTWTTDGAGLVTGTYDPGMIAVDVVGRALWRRSSPKLWPRSLSAAGPAVASASFGGRPQLAGFATGWGLPDGAGAPPPSAEFRGGRVTGVGRWVSAGGNRLWEHDTRVSAVDVLGDRVVASAAHRAVQVMLLPKVGEPIAERAVALHAPEPVKALAVLGSPDIPVVVAASYDFRLWSWTLDWTGIPAGPRLIGEFGFGIADLTRLDAHRLAATDHHGDLVILSLSEDGTLSA